jgi:hypothetical protein
MPIPKQLLEVLVCPLSKAPLIEVGETLVSTDRATRRRYRVENNIPIMLIEESEEVPLEEWEALMRAHGKLDASA